MHFKMKEAVFLSIDVNSKEKCFCLFKTVITASNVKSLTEELIKEMNLLYPSSGSFFKSNNNTFSFKIIGPKNQTDLCQQLLIKANFQLINSVPRESEFEVCYFSKENKLTLSKENISNSHIKSKLNSEDEKESQFAGKPIKVMIVDDSPTIIQLLTMIFKSDKNMEVVAACDDPLQAEDFIKKFKPDVITMDIHMPNMDGVTLVKKIVPIYKIPVVMISSISQEEGPQVLNALEFGAVDYIQKPTLKELDMMTPLIIERVKNAAHVSVAKTQKLLSQNVKVTENFNISSEALVLIGSSTGGTEALKNLFLTLPAKIPPIVVVQHIPPVFSAAFAKRLNEILPYDVVEAKDGDSVIPNKIFIAPGGKQLCLKKMGNLTKIVITDDAPVNRHKPSVDYLFKSALEQDFPHLVSVILTGMGSDGAREMLNLKKAGVKTIAQNKDTCVVYGMPREAVERGAVDFILPLGQIGEKIMQLSSVGAKKNKSA